MNQDITTEMAKTTAHEVQQGTTDNVTDMNKNLIKMKYGNSPQYGRKDNRRVNKARGIQARTVSSSNN